MNATVSTAVSTMETTPGFSLFHAAPEPLHSQLDTTR